MKTVLNLIAAVSSFFSRTFAYIVIVFALIAYFFPDGFTKIAPYIAYLLGIVMFGMGLTMQPKDFAEVLKRPVMVLSGVAGQFILMPVIAYVLVFVFSFFTDMPEFSSIAAGVLLLGCCPGGTSSNVMSYLAKADVPLSVTITACTTLLAPVVTPALFYLMASQWIDIDPVAMFYSIIKIVILPIVGGVIVNLLFKNAVKKVIVSLPLVSIVAIVAIVCAVVALNAQRLAQTGAIIFVLVVLHNCIGYALGYLMGAIFKFRLSAKKTVAIEVGMQNSALSVTLAQNLAKTGAIDPIAAVPGAIFSVWHNISGPIVATIFANMKDKKDNSR